jgi:glucans biosynthesis protein
MPISRRQFLATGTPFALMAMSDPLARAEPARPRFGMAQAFNFDKLRQRARELADRPYVPAVPASDMVAKIDFDAVQKIRFRSDRELWPNGPGAFPVRLFHVDKYNALSVRINELSGGTARPVIYSSQDFDYRDAAVERMLPTDLGYSGFRVLGGHGKETDWLAFQGASYFRSCGEENQYGASARGVAVNTAMPTDEEFPRFVEFWLAEPGNGSASVTIYALLDGPSVTGAYRFEAMKQSGALMDVSAELFFRTDIARLGLAPLTSMYWYGSADRRLATDWRPQIHDSDGLAVWTGSGEHIWRPLLNPASVRTNSFLDENPKGFGLMQRDRAFASYQDDGAFYNKRPSIWVEPVGDWGKGAVQLVEIPTRDEIHDNIVAYWLPDKPIQAGEQMKLAYRLHWQNDEPQPPENLARVIATRSGAGGVPGQIKTDDQAKRKFVVDFLGGPLAAMAPRFDVTPEVTTSRGTIDNAYVIKVVGTRNWRALFDLTPDGKEPIDLRCYLRLGEETLSETWIYQYLPEA